MSAYRLSAAVFGCLVALPSVALAHITLSQPEATAGGSYKATFRVGHGCEGAPTTAVRIRIPEGVIAVKPQPKPGWEITLTTGKYARTYTRFGAEVSEGVTEVAFTGGNLPDAYYDEFVLSTYLPASLEAGTLWFPVVQECPDGAAERWIEIPVEGQPEPEGPAPGLKIVPAS